MSGPTAPAGGGSMPPYEPGPDAELIDPTPPQGITLSVAPPGTPLSGTTAWKDIGYFLPDEVSFSNSWEAARPPAGLPDFRLLSELPDGQGEEPATAPRVWTSEPRTIHCDFKASPGADANLRALISPPRIILTIPLTALKNREHSSWGLYRWWLGRSHSDPFQITGFNPAVWENHVRSSWRLHLWWFRRTHPAARRVKTTYHRRRR
ncbi:hypothetical protein GCM10022252_75030 [Streptosporangium oxazolinicum]|uniref:Uncharacterized protein n=1 Tax=Streptosporangium oxazolinicum TaxID=909287 RepID=A0ABP8BL34_9ACTN